jgi:hypothetical protein
LGTAEDVDMPTLDRPVITGEPEIVGLVKVAPEAVKAPVKVPLEYTLLVMV